MVVFNAIASKPDEIGWTFDNSCRKIFHGTSVLLRMNKNEEKEENIGVNIINMPTKNDGVKMI